MESINEDQSVVPNLTKRPSIAILQSPVGDLNPTTIISPTPRRFSILPINDPMAAQVISAMPRRVSVVPIPNQIAPRVSIVPTSVPSFRTVVRAVQMGQQFGTPVLAQRPILAPAPIRTMIRVPVPKPLVITRSPSIPPDSEFLDTDHVFMVLNVCLMLLL